MIIKQWVANFCKKRNLSHDSVQGDNANHLDLGENSERHHNKAFEVQAVSDRVSVVFRMPKPKQKINPLLKILGKLFKRSVLTNSWLPFFNHFLLDGVTSWQPIPGSSSVPHFALQLSCLWDFFYSGLDSRKYFDGLTESILGFNMRRINSGSRQHRPSNPTKNGETNIFKGILAMKIFCSKEKMF